MEDIAEVMGSTAQGIDPDDDTPSVRVAAAVATSRSGHGTVAILLAGLLIGTAIVASSGSIATGWSWIRDLASVGFVVTLISSGLLLAGVVRRLRRDADDR